MSVEHTHKIVRLAEWEHKICTDLRLAEADRILFAQLALGNDKRLLIKEINGAVSIEATSWIGVMQFTHFVVVIEPKLAGENIDVVRMIEFTQGLHSLTRFTSLRTIKIEGKALFDLIALFFAHSCEMVLRSGLLADYVVYEDVLTVIRGRLLADRQVRRQYSRVDRLECQYDEHETNIPENQLLAVALSFCSRRVRDEEVRRHIRHLAAVFNDACDPSTLNLPLLRQTLVYTRMNSHYREAHILAWLVLDSMGIHDLLQVDRTRNFVFLLDMNVLFEQFVWKIVLAICSKKGLRVRYQSQSRTILWNAWTNIPYRRVIPDILVDNPDNAIPQRFLPIDAKYKPYDKAKVSNEDIYQTFLYALAYNQRLASVLPRSLLIYPNSSSTPQEDVIDIRHGIYGDTLGRISSLGVHIPSLLDEMTKPDLTPDQKNSFLLSRLIESGI